LVELNAIATMPLKIQVVVLKLERRDEHVWDVRYMMDILDLHWLKTSNNHDGAMDDGRAKRHHRVVICNTDAAWMRGKLVQELQMSHKLKGSPRGVLAVSWVLAALAALQL